ncbi:hypothetical protein D3C85_1074790 [compost metagenome]
MRKFIIVAVIAAAAITTSACATNVGTQTVNDFGRYQQLKNGETSKRGVHDIFGQPHTVNYVPATGETIWQYYQVTSRMNPTTFIPFLGLATGGNDLDITRADFFFDSKDVLLRTQREQRSKYVNQWVGLGDAMTPSGQVQAVETEMQKYDLPFDRKEAQIAAGWADWDD